MQDAKITYRGCVYPRDCDHMGHMNVAAYVEKFDNATWNLFTDHGLSRPYLKSEGIGLASVNQNITYKRELLPGDVLTVRSELLELSGKKVRIRSAMYNGDTGELAAEIEQLAVCIDIKSHKARDFPKSILQKTRSYFMGAET